jgi:hypothetical protein
VVGMAAAKEPEGAVRVLLTDGQVVCGRPDAGDGLLLRKAFGDLTIPLAKVKQWSFKVSKDRPQDTQFVGPYLKLRSGDQLAFDPDSIKLELRTKHGTAALDGRHIFRIAMDTGAAHHRVLFINGSSLTGVVEPDKIAPLLRLGPKLDVARGSIHQIQFTAHGSADAALTRAVLANDDTLFGELTEEKYVLKTDYGDLDIRPENIRSIAFDKAQPGSAAVRLWNNSVVRGKFGQEELGFQITPGPAMKVRVSEFAGIVRSQAMPPEETRKQVEKLIAQLASESYKDRQTAGEALVGLGPTIVPLLQKHQKSAKDPEVKARLEELIERLGGKKPPAPPPRPAPMAVPAGVQIKAID